MIDYSKIKYIVLDVDGTMTDGGVYYDSNGNELKKFCTKDGAGFFTAHAVGMQLVVMTGRECPAVIRRMQEMKVEYVFQNVREKRDFLADFMRENQIQKEEVAYIGDDINDYPAMQIVGFVGCPADSCEEVIEIADYVSPLIGGKGAMRDVISYILKQRGEWESAVKKVYHIIDLNGR